MSKKLIILLIILMLVIQVSEVSYALRPMVAKVASPIELNRSLNPGYGDRTFLAEADHKQLQAVERLLTRRDVKKAIRKIINREGKIGVGDYYAIIRHIEAIPRPVDRVLVSLRFKPLIKPLGNAKGSISFSEGPPLRMKARRPTKTVSVSDIIVIKNADMDKDDEIALSTVLEPLGIADELIFEDGFLITKKKGRVKLRTDIYNLHMIRIGTDNKLSSRGIARIPGHDRLYSSVVPCLSSEAILDENEEVVLDVHTHADKPRRELFPSVEDLSSDSRVKKPPVSFLLLNTAGEGRLFIPKSSISNIVLKAVEIVKKYYNDPERILAELKKLYIVKEIVDFETKNKNPDSKAPSAGTADATLLLEKSEFVYRDPEGRLVLRLFADSHETATKPQKSPLFDIVTDGMDEIRMRQLRTANDTIRHEISTNPSKELYRAFYAIYADVLTLGHCRQVADTFQINEEFINILEEIKKQTGVDRIEITIVSRGITQLLEMFFQRPDIKARMERVSTVVVGYRTNTFIFNDTGVFTGKIEEPFVYKKGQHVEQNALFLGDKSDKKYSIPFFIDVNKGLDAAVPILKTWVSAQIQPSPGAQPETPASNLTVLHAIASSA